MRNSYNTLSNDGIGNSRANACRRKDTKKGAFSREIRVEQRLLSPLC